MINKLTQPKGSVSIETNKQSIARIYGIYQKQVGYISSGYIMITLSLLKTSGGIYTKIMSNNIWGSWVKIA